MNGCTRWSLGHKWRHKLAIVPAENATTTKASKFVWFRQCDKCGARRNLIEW